jgi:hypothetical protein
MSHTDLQRLRTLKPYQRDGVLLKTHLGQGNYSINAVSAVLSQTRPLPLIVRGVNTATDQIVLHSRIHFREHWAKRGSNFDDQRKRR